MKRIHAYEDAKGGLHRSKREAVKATLIDLLQNCGANGNEQLAEWLLDSRAEVGSLLYEVDAPEAYPAEPEGR